jgi:hypothetical protein
MKVNYDCETDILTVIFGEAPVAESDEDKEAVSRRFQRRPWG